jgi:translation initiation factor IF-1
MKMELLKKSGVVLEALRGLQFRIKLEEGHEIRAYISGRMNKNKIKIMPGDEVIVEIPQDIKIENCVGRIIIRK